MIIPTWAFWTFWVCVWLGLTIWLSDPGQKGAANNFVDGALSSMLAAILTALTLGAVTYAMREIGYQITLM